MASIFNILLLFFFSLIPFSTSRYHPLDPLTPTELTQVRTIIQTSIPNPNLTFHYVGLHEPDKPIVLSWLSNSNRTRTKTPPRQSFVIARIGQKTHELIVDLNKNSIESNKIYSGYGYPMLTFEEQGAANELTLKYAPFVASMSKRGLKLEEVVCGSYTVGWYGEKKRSKRIVKVLCNYLDGTVNMYMRPIEGITVTVDLDEMKIVEFLDREIVPVPEGEGTDYRWSEQKKPFARRRVKRITTVQPDGHSFKIDGHTSEFYIYINPSGKSREQINRISNVLPLILNKPCIFVLMPQEEFPR